MGRNQSKEIDLEHFSLRHLCIEALEDKQSNWIPDHGLAIFPWCSDEAC